MRPSFVWVVRCRRDQDPIFKHTSGPSEWVVLYWTKDKGEAKRFRRSRMHLTIDRMPYRGVRTGFPKAFIEGPCIRIKKKVWPWSKSPKTPR